MKKILDALIQRAIKERGLRALEIQLLNALAEVRDLQYKETQKQWAAKNNLGVRP